MSAFSESRALSTFVRVSGASPHKWIASFDHLPMLFKAETEQLAISTAREWWATELRKLEEGRARMEKARQGRSSRSAKHIDGAAQ